MRADPDVTTLISTAGCTRLNSFSNAGNTYMPTVIPPPMVNVPVSVC